MAKLIQCKACSKEIAVNAKTCPNCGAKNKKPIYKRPGFIIIVFLLVVGAIAGGGNSTATNNGAIEVTPETKQSQKAEGDALDRNEVKVEAQEPEKDDIPTEYKSALKKAKIYSDTMNMSKVGLYDQLTSEYGEKFSKEAAQYAIDNLEADWKENALKKAKVYQETMAMSPNAIYDQLISEYGEKFTEEEAQYAIDNLE